MSRLHAYARTDHHAERAAAVDALDWLCRSTAEASALTDRAPVAHHRDVCHGVAQCRAAATYHAGVYLALLRRQHQEEALDWPLSDLDGIEHSLRRVAAGIADETEVEQLRADVGRIETQLQRRRCLTCGDECDVSDLRSDGSCRECADCANVPATMTEQTAVAS